MCVNIIWVVKLRRMRWASMWHAWGDRRGAYRVLMGKPEGEGSLGRHRHRWEDNIKMDLQEIGGRLWSGLI
jgi:hypothetical protein